MHSNNIAESIWSLNDIYFQLPIPAYQRMTHVRDEMRQLADFSARIFNEDVELDQAYNALALCFNQLADELTKVMSACKGPLPDGAELSSH